MQTIDEQKQVCKSASQETHTRSHDHEHDHAHTHTHDHGHEHACGWVEILRIVFVGLAAAVVWFEIWEPIGAFSVIGLAATIAGGYPIFKHAIMDIVRRRMTMELSMTIALVAASLIGEFVTVLVIVFFVLVAEVLEGLTVGRGRRAIKELLEFVPQTVHVRRDGSVGEIDAEELAAGETVVIKPGSRIPVDGVVLGGHSFVDQATITGESLPVEKVPGTDVYAGTVNQSGTLDVRVTRLGRNTIFGKIIEEVERAEQNRAPIQKTADRLAGYLVYFAIACAVLTFLVTHDIRSTISVIIVAGACGIAAGTPLAVLGAIGRAARQGAIIKGGIYLEVLWGVDTVVLDKTGTLTFGNPEVVATETAKGITKEELLAAAATAERPTEHPLGKAILKYADACGVQSDESRLCNQLHYRLHHHQCRLWVRHRRKSDQYQLQLRFPDPGSVMEPAVPAYFGLDQQQCSRILYL